MNVTGRRIVVARLGCFAFRYSSARRFDSKLTIYRDYVGLATVIKEGKWTYCGT
jgi:hypothetical protein